MRCQKCNFVSFDHLSECKNCGVDLKVVRDQMGYLPGEPSVPFFLGTLLKDGGGNIAGKFDTGAPSMESSPSSLSEIEFNEVFELDTMELSADSNPMAPIAPPLAQAEMKGHLDSALKVFQDIETLDGPVSKLQAAQPTNDQGDDQEFEIDFMLEDSISFDDVATLAETPKPQAKPQASMEFPELNLQKDPERQRTAMNETLPGAAAMEASDSDLDQLVLDSDFEEDLELDFDDASPEPAAIAPKAETSPTAAVEDSDLDQLVLDSDFEGDLELDFDDISPEQAGSTQGMAESAKVIENPSAKDTEESFVMELSEDDLESLVLELEEADGEKKPGNSGKK